MKRLTNIYPILVLGFQVFAFFDHFTDAGQQVFNVEFLAVSGTTTTYLVRYSGIKATTQEQAAKIAVNNFLTVNK